MGALYYIIYHAILRGVKQQRRH